MAKTMDESAPANDAGAAHAEAPAASRIDSVIDETLRRRNAELAFKQAEFTYLQRRAKLFSMSGLFGKSKDEEPGSETAIARALARIELGASMGFCEAESLQGIYIIADQLCVSSALRASRMRQAGYDWDIAWHWSGEPRECVGITMWLGRGRERDGRLIPVLDHEGVPISVSYTREDAEKMLTTVWDNGQKRRVSILEKDNWRMSPKNMYFARCVTNMQRWHCSEVLNANLPTAEEVMDYDSSPADKIHGSREMQEQAAERKIAELRQRGAVHDVPPLSDEEWRRKEREFEQARKVATEPPPSDEKETTQEESGSASQTGPRSQAGFNFRKRDK
jgi:hypothetical protein